jgi:hypothetical protein
VVKFSVYNLPSAKKNKKFNDLAVHFHIINPRSPPFSEDEIQGLFQEFQGPFSVYSRIWKLEKSLKII